MRQLLAAAGAGGASAGAGATEAHTFFADVGGPDAWRQLLQALRPALASAGHWG